MGSSSSSSTGGNQTIDFDQHFNIHSSPSPPNNSTASSPFQNNPLHLVSPSGTNNGPLSSNQITQTYPTGTTLTTVDGLPVFKRKRGRPPKNRSSELINQPINNLINSPISSLINSPINSLISGNGNPNEMKNPFSSLSPLDLAALLYGANPSAMRAAFGSGGIDLKSLSNCPSLSNQLISQSLSSDGTDGLIPVPILPASLSPEKESGFYVFQQNSPCPEPSCVYFGKLHYHCSWPRCYTVQDKRDHLQSHSQDFHDEITILDGFAFFDANFDCHVISCSYNKKQSHFHCTRCLDTHAQSTISFIQANEMRIHEEDTHRSLSISSGNNNNNDKLSQKSGDDFSDESIPPSPKGGIRSNDGAKGSSDHDRDEEAGTPNSSSSLSSLDKYGRPKVKSSGIYYPLSSLKGTSSSQSPKQSTERNLNSAGSSPLNHAHLMRNLFPSMSSTNSVNPNSMNTNSLNPSSL